MKFLLLCLFAASLPSASFAAQCKTKDKPKASCSGGCEIDYKCNSKTGKWEIIETELCSTCDLAVTPPRNANDPIEWE